MKIEHLALNVQDPAGMAAWYCKNLGMNVARTNGVGWFLADAMGHTLLEIYTSPSQPVPVYAEMDPQVLHLAFVSQDVQSDRQKLMAAGASACDEVSKAPSGDSFAMLRDPWGLPIQLAKRSEPLV